MSRSLAMPDPGDFGQGARRRPGKLEGANAWALFLDVDGTLLEIAARPEAVVVSDAVRGLLDHLEHRLGGAMALVTGRTIEQVDILFAPLKLRVAGVHGAQSRHGPLLPALPEITAQVDALAAEFEARFAGIPGVLVERKGIALALHYRQAPGAELLVQAAAQSALARLAETHRLVDGKAVYELLPRVANKGAAIVRLMGQPPFAGRRPVFVGDDVVDESAFVAVNAMDGLSIRVGSGRPTAARCELPNVAGVLEWLRTGMCPNVGGGSAA